MGGYNHNHIDYDSILLVVGFIMNAYYDPVKNKIFGCKKYSRVWWHERGHQEYDKLGKEINVNRMFHFCLFFSLIFIIVGKMGMAITMVAFMFYFYMHPEIWAERFAYKNKKLWRGYK